MLLPYAIVRADSQLAVDRGACDEPLTRVSASGLAMVVGQQAESRPSPASFMTVVTAVHESTVCLPMRLTEAAFDGDSAVRVLESGAARFHRMLDAFEGADEWSVTVPSSKNVSLSSRRASANGHGGTGLAYLEQRRRELDAAAGVSQEVSILMQTLSRLIAPRSRDTRALSLSGGGRSLAVLVDRSTDAYELLCSAADRAAAPCIVSGPWPPFSFTSMS